MKLRHLLSALLFFGFVTGSAQVRADGGWAPVFVVNGQVQTPRTIYASDLKKLPQTQENVTYFASGAVVTQFFTGVLLWDLLQYVGIVLDPNVKNDILRKTIVVTGSDGYETVFGAGEVSPNFGGDQIMIAWLANGQPLGSDGPTRIVVPGDKQGGRFVSSIVTITVKDGG